MKTYTWVSVQAVPFPERKESIQHNTNPNNNVRRLFQKYGEARVFYIGNLPPNQSGTKRYEKSVRALHLTNV